MRVAVQMAVALLGVLAVATPGGAASLVVFDDGRGLVVDRWEAEGGVITLYLDGGGAIAIPAFRVSSVRPYQAPKELETPVDDSWREWAGEYAELISSAADRYDLAPSLLAAMALVESNFDPYAVSSKGACGMLQLIPGTAERFGVEDVFDARANVEGGAKYMRWLLDRFDGRTDLALAAYNSGENTVARYKGIPPYKETRTYVAKVLKNAGLPEAR